MKLFLGGLPAETTEQDIRNALREYEPERVSLPPLRPDKTARIAFVEIRNEGLFRRALQDSPRGIPVQICRKRIYVREYVKPVHDGSAPAARRDVTGASADGPAAGTGFRQTAGDFPYGFVSRRAGKGPPVAFHDRLAAGRFDVAFEVTWTTITPTALNPCEDPAVGVGALGQDGENTGYNKRWLTIDGRLAISPFTVKGAVAGGIADILGGCYRIPDREEGHNPSLGEGAYPYTGKWKRYRVSMNGKSHPGIVRSIDTATGHVRIQPVTEYFYDDKDLPVHLEPGAACYAAWRESRHRNIISRLDASPFPGGKGVIHYHGPYRFGMNRQLRAGDLGKKHSHRFYSSAGREIEGNVPPLSFVPREKLLEKVYGGRFCKGDPGELKPADPRRGLIGAPWYEDLADLKPGDFCYYTAFRDGSGAPRIAAVGTCFQFKALFSHGDAVPPGNETCLDMNRLCPRCRLFGIADREGGAGKQAVGYAGRFQSSALVSGDTVTETSLPGAVPVEKTPGARPVRFSAWQAGEQLVARQFLLPILGPPKPSRRDVNGYYDEETGTIKGAKRYHHARLDFEKSLPALIARTDENRDYGHRLRPVAAVVREGIGFSGTVGGRNCSSEEIAALVILLDRRAADHGFKMGIGKSLGLGSVTSRIRRVWVRSPQTYRWESADVPFPGEKNDLFASLKPILPDALEAIKRLLNDPATLRKVHRMADEKQGLALPRPGLSYWRDADVERY